MNHRRFFLIFSLLLSLALAGCAGDGGDDTIVSQFIPMSGGTFPFRSGDFTLIVPNGSINQAATVTVDPATNFPANTRLISGTAFRASSGTNVQFNQVNPATIRIRYPQLLGADPTTYSIHQLEGNLWAEIHSHVNTTDRYVQAEVDSLGTFAIFAGVPGTTFRTVLGPGQETGAVLGTDINASGTARVTIPQTPTELMVEINSTGLTNVSAAHIHVGGLGQPGPVRATLFNAANIGETWSDDFHVTVDNARLSGITMAELIQAIEDGNAYINVHTTTNPGGAIRGQLGDNVMMSALLTGNAEVPPSGSTATGTGSVTFNRTMTEFSVMLDTTNLANVRMAHIHNGIPGEAGPVNFTLFNGTNWTGHLMMNITAANFVPSAGIATFNDAVNAILSGDMYFNVHTVAFPDGEIRGQIVPHMP